MNFFNNIEQDQDQISMQYLQDGAQESLKDGQFSQNRVPSPLMNNYGPFGSQVQTGHSSGTPQQISTYRSQNSDISQSYVGTHQSTSGPGTNLNSMRPTIIGVDNFSKPLLSPLTIQRQTVKQNLKIGGKSEKHLEQRINNEQDQPSNALGLPMTTAFGGDTFQLLVDQDAVMHSEEDSLCFQLSQSGCDTRRSKNEDSFFNNQQKHLSRVSKESSDIYSISVSNQKSGQKSIMRSNQKSGSGIPRSNQFTISRSSNLIGFGLTSGTLSNVSPFQRTDDGDLNFSATPKSKFSRDIQTDRKDTSSIKKQLFKDDPEPYENQQSNFIHIDEQDASMLMQLETVKREKAQSSSNHSQSQRKLIEQQNYLSYLDSNHKVETFELPQAYKTETHPQPMQKETPAPIEMSKVISKQLKNMLKETELAQKKIRAGKGSKLKLKMKQVVKNSKAGATTSRTTSSIPDQSRLASSRSLFPIKLKKKVSTIDSNQTTEQNCQQGPEKKKIEPLQMLKRGRSSKGSINTKSPVNSNFQSRGNSIIKIGSGTISGSGLSGGSGGGISLTRKNSINKAINTKLKLKAITNSNDTKLKKSDSSKTRLNLKSRNTDDFKRLKTTESVSKFQPRPLSSRKMTIQVPTKNKENVNTKNVKKISLQRKMSVQNSSLLKHIQSDAQKPDQTQVEAKRKTKNIKNTERMKQMQKQNSTNLKAKTALDSSRKPKITNSQKIQQKMAEHKRSQEQPKAARARSAFRKVAPSGKESCIQCQRLLEYMMQQPKVDPTVIQEFTHSHRH